ncbi:MAG: tRNA epoxyqueuosine(34) reductase QueG [Gemmatimonadota bacterium]
MNEARETIRRAGLDLGFAQVGFAPAEAPAHSEVFLQWLDRSMHGEMAYMARQDTVRRRLEPAAALPGCRTVIMVSLLYGPSDAPPTDADADAFLRPILAQYSQGRDYHSVFEERLSRFSESIRALHPAAAIKAYVDYGPVLERDHAQRAGLGWIGKNTMLIHPTYGSWLLLGELLTDLAIEPDAAFLPDHCGTCERCIEACPTGAIRGPRELDARLCISYLTIELKGAIPEKLRPMIGQRVFGCDICQDVCPWNTGPEPADTAPFAFGQPLAPASMALWAEQLLEMSDEEFARRYEDTALSRPGRSGLLRNVCVGLGNSGQPEALGLLERCLADRSPLVVEHAAWAIRRLREGSI